jgi:hypothetical protein
VSSVFTVDGTEPRFALTADDHRGLAVLAEAAGLFDVAQRHYQKHLAVLAPEATRTQDHLRRHLQTLEAEKGAADVWTRAVALGVEIREWLRARDPAFLPANGFTQDIRDAFTDPKQRAEILKKFEDARALLHALENDPRYATTLWGTVLRARPHPAMRFVPNEPAPVAPPGPPPPAPPKAADGDKPAGDGEPQVRKDDDPAAQDGPPGDKPGGDKPGADKPGADPNADPGGGGVPAPPSGGPPPPK